MRPQKFGVAYADIMTGLYSVIAIHAALATRRYDGIAAARREATPKQRRWATRLGRCSARDARCLFEEAETDRRSAARSERKPENVIARNDALVDRQRAGVCAVVGARPIGIDLRLVPLARRQKA